MTLPKRLTTKQIAELEDREAVAAAREDAELLMRDVQGYKRELAQRDEELAAREAAAAALEGLSPQALELLPGLVETRGADL